MATVLLVVIFIDFIGLGVPDSLFGTAWPAIYPEFGLPVSAANLVTLLISGCTVLSSLLSARVINRFGTAAVTAVSTCLTAVALFGFSVAPHLLWLAVCALPLGLGAGAIDSALNNYVALHYRATHMNFLHCFYGVGVALSPYLMSVALAGADGWRGGYRMAFYLQSAIAAVTLLSLPLWRRMHPAVTAAEESEPHTLRLRELVKMPAVRQVWGVFIGSVAIESTCGAWGSTFLVSAKGLPAETAALAIAVYYVGMTIGRFLSGVLSVRLSSWQLVRLGQGVLLAALVLLVLPLPPIVGCAALFLVGLGNGPVYPNLIHLTPKNFGRDISQSVMGSQMAVAAAAIMLLPPVFGFLAQAWGVGLFPYYLLAMFAVMGVMTWRLIRTLKKENRYS